MIYPSADKIDEQIDSKYALVILAAKRAKQIKEHSRPLIATDSTNPLTIALEEIASGSIQYAFDEDSLAGREALADEKAVVGARNIEVDMDPLALPDDAELLRAAREALGDVDTAKTFGEEEDGEGVLADAEEEEEEEDPLIIGDDETEGTDI